MGARWRGWLPTLVAMCVPLASSAVAQGAPTPVELAVDYTISVQKDDGLFNYEYDFLTGQWSQNDNIVRQAGTTYALALFFAHSKDDEAGASIATALEALNATSVPFGDGYLLSAEGSVETASAGATALALIAALLTDGPDARAQGWLRGLVALQRPDGRISQGPMQDQPNPYFDGETWLAFAYAAQMGLLGEEPDGVLRRTDAGLMKTYSDNPDGAFFHWGQLAAELRYKSTARSAFVDFSIQQVATYLAEMRPRVPSAGNGCYAVEGLAAALTTLADDARLTLLRVNVEQRIATVLEIADGLQIKPGAKGIALREGVFLTVPEIDRFTGAFLNGKTRPQTRIDTTHHCLAAFLSAEQKGLGD